MADFTLNSYSISYASGEVTNLAYLWDISNYSQAFLRITHPNSSITASTPVFPPTAPGSGKSVTIGISFTASIVGSYSVQAYVVRGGVEYAAGSAATFSVYSMSVSAGTGISSVNGSRLFTNNVSFSISATPASGYVFDGWYSGSVKFSSTNSLTFNNSSTSRSLEARGVSAYTVTLYPISETSTFYVPTGAGSYIAGSNVNININMKAGYRFLYWKDASDTVIFTTASATITNISSDIALWPVAETIVYYAVTLDYDTTTISSVSGGGSKESGTTAAISAVPASGYVFSHWSVGGSQVSTSNSYSFTVTGNITLKAWGKSPVVRPPSWTWTASNGSASSAQTQAAYNAVTKVSGYDLSNFSYLVWNDLVDKVDAFCTYKSSPLVDSRARMASSDRGLSHEKFNYLIAAVNVIASTGITDRAKDDPVVGSYFTTIVTTLNGIA